MAPSMAMPWHAQPRGRIHLEVGQPLAPEIKATEGRTGILLTSRKLQSFGHKCKDDECGPKASEKAWPQGEGPDNSDRAPSFFQVDQAMQSVKGSDDEVAEGSEVEAQHSMPEVSPELAAEEEGEVASAGDGVVRNASLLQLTPGRISAPSAPSADDKEVLDVVRQAVATLEAQTRESSKAPSGEPALDKVVAALSSPDGHPVVESSAPAVMEDGLGAQDPALDQSRRGVPDVSTPTVTEDPVLKALEDGVGAQDPAFAQNRRAVPDASAPTVTEDPVLRSLEDGVGAQDPTFNQNRSTAAENKRGFASNRSVAMDSPEKSKSHSNVSAVDTVVAAMSAEGGPVAVDLAAPTLTDPVLKALEDGVGAQDPALDQTRAMVGYGRSFWSTRSGALAAAVGFVAATWLAVICLATGFWMAVTTGWRESKGNVRSAVEALKRCTAADVEKLTPSQGGYDCNFSKPISSKRVLRLEVRVEGTEHGEPLTAPLTGHSCVLHSAAVSKQLHDGMPAVPIAFSASSADFVVSLLDDPDARIVVRGCDVSLFDTSHGRCEDQKRFGEAPDNWQDFVLTHRSAAPQGRECASSSLREDEAILEFQECALLVGSVVTVVGELHRGADGQLTLRPFQGDDTTAFWRAKKSLREPWRTSWESGGDEKQHSRVASSPNVLKQKVFISDDEGLLQKDVPDVDGKLRECATVSAPGWGDNDVWATPTPCAKLR
eukprot:CAMPEP_0181400898 /NCGR_PEP_ID=MMETSP1110-20121109/2354_1 /TAXON_ID=174948 /ORGANISM="Symbiodinium sp., Strain CCMP421" /LENGTH=716 /DNA_ID=CAMNT_0023523015 /DNA_START=30 /DNA_END=2178 /DNA_ORIENTATION=-